ncbi:protein N-acetylglucosaminyltransferase [Aureococcus anophagefferens]|nr:protein N-acetylglucosaminyltransferase [Aureococcus anophagefferens]
MGCLAVALWLLALPALCSGEDEAARERLAAAAAAHERGDFASALAAAEAACGLCAGGACAASRAAHAEHTRGVVLASLGRKTDAAAAFEACLARDAAHGHAAAALAAPPLRPRRRRGGPQRLRGGARAAGNYAIQLRDVGDLGGALAAGRRGLELDPNSVPMLHNVALIEQRLGNVSGAVLPHIYDDGDHMDRVWVAYTEALRRLLRAPTLRIVDPLHSTGSGALGYYLEYVGYADLPPPEQEKGAKFPISKAPISAVFHSPPRRLLARVYWRGARSDLAWRAPFLDAPRAPGKLRVGFLSAFFFTHSVGLLTAGVVETLDRSRFTVAVLHVAGEPEDELTAKLRGAADVYARVPAGSLDAARRAVAALELDVLVFCEVGMNTMTYFLTFARLARRSALFWGHAVTSGVARSDGEAAGAAGAAGGVDYLCPRRVDGSADRWARSIPEDVRARVVFFRRLDFREFVKLAQLADVVLDPFPVGGGRSSLEILSTGTPIVLLEPRTSVLQLTRGMYELMGDPCPACVTQTPEAFVAAAVRVAKFDSAQIRARILERRGVLYENDGVTREWEAFLAHVAAAPRPAGPGRRAIFAREALAAAGARATRRPAPVFDPDDAEFERSFSLKARDAGLRVAYLPRVTLAHIGVDESAYALNNVSRPWDGHAMKIATMSAMIALIVGFRAALFAEGVSDQCEFLPPLIPKGGSLASRARCCELLPDADACSVSSQYADEYNCRNTLDGEYDEDGGWYAGSGQTTDQWIAYDLKETHNVTGVCLVWDWFDDKIYGATSVRVDTSTDGSTWTEGATYDEGDGMCGSLGDPSSLPADVMDACFTLRSSVETQHIRLFFEFAADCSVVVESFWYYGGSCETYCEAQQGGILECVAHFDEDDNTCMRDGEDRGCADTTSSSDNICVCAAAVRSHARSDVKSEDGIDLICDGNTPLTSPQADCSVVVESFWYYGGSCKTYCEAQQGGIPRHTPSKRQRREAAAATPATPAAPPSLRQRGVSLARVAADVGSLAAATSRHPRFASAELYGPLLGAADAGAAGAVARAAAAPRREATALAAAWDDTTFLVGHKLSADLRALRVRGGALRRRSIDTVLLHWAPRAAGLRAPADVPRAAARAAGSARAPRPGPRRGRRRRRDARRRPPRPPALRGGPRRGPRSRCRRPRGGPAAVDAPARLVGRVIGKRGAALAALRGAHPAVDVDVDSTGGGRRQPRRRRRRRPGGRRRVPRRARRPRPGLTPPRGREARLAKHAPPGDRGAA